MSRELIIMENYRLEKEADKFKDSALSIIDDLINEIEEQEAVMEKLNDRIEELEEELANLKN